MKLQVRNNWENLTWMINNVDVTNILVALSLKFPNGEQIQYDVTWKQESVSYGDQGKVYTANPSVAYIEVDFNGVKRNQRLDHVATVEVEIEAVIVEGDEQQAALTSELRIKEVAVQLHDSLCRWNHTDGCGWHYEIKKGIHDWTKSSHKSWLDNTIKYLADMTDMGITDTDLIVKIAKRTKQVW